MQKRAVILGGSDGSIIVEQTGKVSMGMDLIPYYGDDAEKFTGTVRLIPTLLITLGLQLQPSRPRDSATNIETVGYHSV